jgi:hypothetical protein
MEDPMPLRDSKTIQRPSLTNIIVPFFFILSLFFLLTSVLIYHHATLDSTWTLKAGQYMLAHHKVIRQDIFSYTLPAHSWVALEWGFEVLLAILYHLFGSYGYFLAVMPALLGLLIVLFFLLRPVPLIYRLLLLELATFGIFSEVFVRAQIYSYFFLVITFLILRCAPKTQLLLFPLLLLLWANFHGSFPLGIGIYLLYLVYRPSWSKIATLCLASLATLLNPYGLTLWTYALHLTFSSNISQYVGEWQSPNFHNISLMGLYVIPLLITARFFNPRHPLSYITLGSGIATLHAQRFGVYFILCFVYFISEHQFFQNDIPSWSLRKDNAFKTNLILNLATIVVALLFILNLSTITNFTPQKLQSIPQNPIKPALSYIGSQPGRIFTLYNDSGGLIIDNKKVFIDSRADFYMPTPIFNLYLLVADGTSQALPILRNYNVRWVILPSGTYLGEVLRIQGVPRIPVGNNLEVYKIPKVKAVR